MIPDKEWEEWNERMDREVENSLMKAAEEYQKARAELKRHSAERLKVETTNRESSDSSPKETPNSKP